MVVLGVMIILLLLGLIFLLVDLNGDLKNEIESLTKAYKEAKRALSYYKMRYEVEKRTISNEADLLEAIRVAMKASHPDNGGSAEDFIKFRKLYNNLGGRR